MSNRDLLSNEESFDLLFCESGRVQGATIYYNKHFSDDPVFNHVILDQGVLESNDTTNYTFEKILSEAYLACGGLGIPCTVFADDFWNNSERLQLVAVDNGFRVFERMEILTKPLSANVSGEIRSDIHVERTHDIDLWNDVFARSYSIPPEWTEELLRREKRIAENGSGVFILAREKDEARVGPASGCLLLHECPKGLMGVYCVGTLPERRSRGVARAMLLFSEGIAAKTGCNLMVLQTLLGDHVSPMYEKLGYTIRFRRNLLQRL